MSKQISRRDFLKLATAGAATTAVLTGCGPTSRFVSREPYLKMPEYTYNGMSTYYATTCRECAAACGLVVRTMQGRAIKVEGNANNPVNLGKTCARGQATLQGLYNPDRVENPVKQARGAQLSQETLDWNAAIQIVSDALKNTKPSEIAFLMGMAPDHLFDLVSDLAKAIGAPAPIRFGALGMFEARATLSKAAEDLFGKASMPFFDLENADVVISFGSNFLETWLSPVALTRGFAKMRRGNPERRGYFVQFEARMSQTASKADEWIPLRPGTESLVALALGRLIAEAKGGSLPPAFASVDPLTAAADAGVQLEVLERLAQALVKANRPLVIPGGAALGQSNGLAVAESVLALNALLGNFGLPGGVFISPLAPAQDAYHRPASAKEMTDFIAKMKNGGVKVLFVHGVNPVFELPKHLGFAEALAAVPQVISFATFPDETALASDYIFPDHHGLESWGYQRAVVSAKPVLSGAQPVVTPYFNTRATADVFLAAAALAGGKFAEALPFADEVAFIQSKLTQLVGEEGFFTAPEINSFTAYFQQYGGWWTSDPALATPSAANAIAKRFTPAAAEFAGEGEFFFLPFVSPTLGEAGANKPWLQELADPTTTVMWNTWVEMNPVTAHELGIENDDIVEIVSEAGSVEAPVYLYPAIRPDVIAMPFGQGHTAYGRFASGRGANPADVLGSHFNEAGDLAFAGMKVAVKKTGKTKVLSRLESRIGVYGEGLEKE
ncbi:MAG: molybdopterin-dependent oxidoreductase [Chloroflexota bacterium]|nr:molybdopterin-dependent oxidoreductase [Chloroflexota bacterium]MBI5704259.1 molybdopterin-dependent oxidoreductase [Chloroflexota bacterium]